MLFLGASEQHWTLGPRVGGFYTCLPQVVCIAGQSDSVCLHYMVYLFTLGTHVTSMGKDRKHENKFLGLQEPSSNISTIK